jgi:phage protein D
MRPSFSIIANGQDISGEITRRLVSMDITDTVDETSDGITIVLEDTTQSLALPKSGARLEVSLGWNGDNSKIGTFIVDEVSIEGPPDIITITASSTPFVNGSGGSASFSGKKTRSWDGKTVGDIVSKIASECGLSPVVDDTLKNVPIPHIDQLNESDANLLIRIARRYGGVLKPAEGRLIFSAEEGGKTTSGKAFSLTITPSEITSYRSRIGGKSQGVTKVKARVHNYQTGESEEVDVEVKKPQFGE